MSSCGGLAPATARAAAYFAAYVQQRSAAVHRSRQAAAELDGERANILEAWEWAAAHGQPELLDRLRPGVLRFHQAVAAAVPPAGGAPAVRTRPALAPPGAEATSDVPELTRQELTRQELTHAAP